MPAYAYQGVTALLALLFGWSIFSFPGTGDELNVNIATWQNEAYYGSIHFPGHDEGSVLEIRWMEGEKKDSGKVKVTFRRKGEDVSVTYERGQQVTDMDIMVIEKILEQIDKPEPNKIQSKIIGTFKSFLDRPSKRGFVRKFLP